MSLIDIPVFVIGANRAPIFLEVIGENFLNPPEIIMQNIYDLNEDEKTLNKSIQQKAMTLANRKVFEKIATSSSGKRAIFFGFHSVAGFQDKELICLDTAEDIKRVLWLVAGSLYTYCAGISVGVSNGKEIETFSSELVTVRPEIKSLAMEKIYSIVDAIPLDELPLCNLAYRPLTSPHLKTLMDRQDLEVIALKSGLEQAVKRMLVNVGLL